MNDKGAEVLNQHLIDPVICIRCNTCEDTCPLDAVSHGEFNYVVDPDICNACGACIAPCPTGAIDNWRSVAKSDAYSLEEQLEWEELPDETAPLASADTTQPEPEAIAGFVPVASLDTHRGAAIKPMSAAEPIVNHSSVAMPTMAKVAGNYRVTSADRETDTHHIVLDFGSALFPVLEGQSIGIIPPGQDVRGRPHHARQYSVASPRDGERPGYNNLSLTVKRVLKDYQGNPVHGVASNYLCDLKKGDEVRVIGPFGATFLMPNDPAANLLMICTGTGSAPMRAMTERRRRGQRATDGKLMLFFGARTQEELPYFGPLMRLPRDFIDINLAFSRAPDAPKTYVQDLMQKKSQQIAELLSDAKTCIYVCGLRGMEDGVLSVLEDSARQAGLSWHQLHQQLREQGRIHFETY